MEMMRKLGRKLHDFYEDHEKSLRTELILIPILVLTIKMFEDNFDQYGAAVSIIYIISISLACYLIGIMILTMIGDFLWRRFLFRFNELYDYRGVYVQVTGAGNRTFAISRIFINYSTGKFMYRGIAFNIDTFEQAASWQSELSYFDVIDNHRVLYFTGVSIIKEMNEYDPKLFPSRVFSILCFTSSGTFNGAGFDFQRRDIGDHVRDTFPLIGYRIDERAMKQYCVDDKLLLDIPLVIYQKDKDAIKKYAKENKYM